jgi:hypothetical protein
MRAIMDERRRGHHTRELPIITLIDEGQTRHRTWG